jgi:AcrR family transcriptional regulator
MASTTTDSRLLDVAVDHFGRHGRDGASTRAIARDAGTPMSSITYHFGGKDGLYLAAAEHIAADMRRHIAPSIERAGALCAADGGSADARAAIHAILGGMIVMMLDDRMAAMARFIVREQADPTEAFDCIYTGVMGGMLDRISGLVMRVSDNRLDRDAARVRAITLVGQVLVFRVARATVVAGMGWARIGQDEAAMIARIVAANLDAILDQIEADRRRMTGDHA